MTQVIRHQFLFPHPPQAVWEYLTKPELMQLWLMRNDFQPIVGFDFQFRTNPIPSLDFDGIFYCKVLEIEPFEKLSYSWKSGPGDGEITLESVVEWKLEATEKGTTLFLEHSGFARPENLVFYNGLADGWIKNLQKMANHLNTEKDANANA
ncbi:SRPBCC family protein [Mucilaginibacter agri]|uniref:Activator of Hsp90 ATPase homologue 1/2-like C-terminal domain-containing protein n=1 Tax=Mucilaginibacter agri TaxID=2695265 RepID=A0A965ZIU6_9SPHI|nr:SRPBCC domain-containing protein [Mucilaginibacter agri]NCD70769.1 hypothetical protein [Mucilaginibacter agri]